MATKFLQLEQFTFVVSPPESRTNGMFINVYSDGRFCLNGKLAKELYGKPLQIRFTEDARNLCILETSSDEAIIFPKNGSKRLSSIIEHLKKHKIPFPARYEICYDEMQKIWQGEKCENPSSATLQSLPRLKKN